MYYKRKMTAAVHPMQSSQRPREKLLASGCGSLTDAELLAVLISHPDYQEEALGIAAGLLDLAEGSLAALSQYLPEEFKMVSGVGDVRAATLCAAMELGRRLASAPVREKRRISEPEEAAALFMEDLRHLKKEVLSVALISVRNELIGIENVSMGSIRSAGFAPRDIFAGAIKRGAHGLILAHNHPSGDPSPSAADISMTKQIAEAGRILGIQVLDHIVIGDGVFFSFKQDGIL